MSDNRKIFEFFLNICIKSLKVLNFVFKINQSNLGQSDQSNISIYYYYL